MKKLIETEASSGQARHLAIARAVSVPVSSSGIMWVSRSTRRTSSSIAGCHLDCRLPGTRSSTVEARLSRAALHASMHAGCSDSCSRWMIANNDRNPASNSHRGCPSFGCTAVHSGVGAWEHVQVMASNQRREHTSAVSPAAATKLWYALRAD